MSFSSEDEDDALQAMLDGMDVDEAVDTWRAILADIKKGGPMARLLLFFRRDATNALRDLTLCARDKYESDAEHSKAITDLQQRIQQFLHTMVAIHTFRDITKGVEARQALSSDDERILARAVED